MTTTVIEHYTKTNDIDETKKTNIYVSEQVFLHEHKVYHLYFSSSKIEFNCDNCHTINYKDCNCDDITWTSNFMRSNKILSCENKDGLLEIYNKMIENVNLLERLSREPFIDWIYDNVNDIDNMYVEIGF